MRQRIAILGAGSWGTALAVHCARVGHDVGLWGRDQLLIDDMSERRENARYLPGVTLPGSISLSASLARTLDGAAIAVAAIPSHGMRTVMRAAAPSLGSIRAVVSAAKGLESDTLARMSAVIAEAAAGPPVVVLTAAACASSTANAPFAMSSAITVTPRDVRVVRSTFAAPTLPLPVTRTSMPARRASMNANGTEPAA